MSDSTYTIDDLIYSLKRKDVVMGATLDLGSTIFYVHMAYALGMGLQPSPMYAKIAELERAYGRPLQGPEGVSIPPVVIP